MLALLLACVHKVQITSTPPGAVLFMDGQRLGSTPEVVRIRMLKPVRLSVQLPGYRTLTFHPNARMLFWGFLIEAVSFQWKKSLGLTPYGSMEVIMVQDHPTWGGGSPDLSPEVPDPATPPAPPE